MTIHTFQLQESLMTALGIVPPIDKEDPDLMDWEWTPDPIPVPSLAIGVDEKIKKGKMKLTTAKDPDDVADRAARS